MNLLIKIASTVVTLILLSGCATNMPYKIYKEAHTEKDFYIEVQGVDKSELGVILVEVDGNVSTYERRESQQGNEYILLTLNIISKSEELLELDVKDFILYDTGRGIEYRAEEMITKKVLPAYNNIKLEIHYQTFAGTVPDEFIYKGTHYRIFTKESVDKQDAKLAN